MPEKPYTLHRVNDDHWRELAAFGWRNYQLNGRGIVFVDMVEGMTLTDAGFRIAPVYLLLDDPRLPGLMEGSPFENTWNSLASMVEHYRPHIEIVLLAREPDGEVLHRIGANPYLLPPDAAAQDT